MLSNETKGAWLASASQVIAWFVSIALGLIDMLAVREAILSLLSWARVIQTEAYHRSGGLGQDIFGGFGLTAIDTVMLLILGLVTVAAIIGIETYFRKGRAKGLLYKRIVKVFLIEIAIFVGAVVIQQIVGMILSASA